MVSNNPDSEDIRQIKREIVLLKRKIARLKFKNSPLFKILNTINTFVVVVYVQYIISYAFDFNYADIPNTNIQFNVYSYPSNRIKLYTIKFKYKNYFFRVKVNKEVSTSLMNFNATISKDMFLQIPQKFRLNTVNSSWWIINESLGILTICTIIVFVQVVAFVFKQNEHYYPLLSISALTIFSFVGIVFFSLHIHNFI